MTTKQAAEKIIEPNCKNRTVFIGDNREVMLGLNADIADAIITDPPFNTGQMRKDDQVKIDKKKSKQTQLVDIHGNVVQAYSDKWTLKSIEPELEFIKYKDKSLVRFCQIIGNQHSDGMEAYLLMMASRLLLCHEILKETGSIFLHCDISANGYLRMLMDAIFGKENFRNEIVWSYKKWTNACKYFQRNHDTILFYAKNAGQMKFNKLFGPLSKDQIRIRKTGYNGGTDNQGRKILRVYDREKAAKKIKQAEAEGRIVYYIDDPHEGSPLSAVWEMPILGGG